MAHDPFQALRYRDYRLYALSGIFVMVAHQIQAVAIGWELYERTHSALMLGYVGLAQFLPVLLLTLPAGQMADRYNRRHIVLITQIAQIICSIALFTLSHLNGPEWGYLAILSLSSVATAFQSPAFSALLPQVVPEEAFENAAVWNSSVMQVSMVLGPALGGFQIALQHRAEGVYIADAVLNILFFICIFCIVSRQKPLQSEAMTLKSLLAGARFVWRTKIILAALTLDLFAVLLGGATTLLPIFAKDILHVGPDGLGWLRAAPSLGALLMAITLAFAPPLRQAGKLLIISVTGFGLCMVGFGLSKVLWFSLLCLLLSGALDNISVVIRSSLVQLRTPNALRGRVLAINRVFISSSNELGGFESGLTAALFGPILSVAGGGIGTIITVGAVAAAWPELMRLDRLSTDEPILSTVDSELEDVLNDNSSLTVR